MRASGSVVPVSRARRLEKGRQPSTILAILGRVAALVAEVLALARQQFQFDWAGAMAQTALAWRSLP